MFWIQVENEGCFKSVKIIITSWIVMANVLFHGYGYYFVSYSFHIIVMS